MKTGKVKCRWEDFILTSSSSASAMMFDVLCMQDPKTRRILRVMRGKN